jgi:glycosyltransferase involved in cell wall biosynthesis
MKINFFGPVGRSGYGRITNQLVPAMNRQGMDTMVYPIYSQEIPDQELNKHINPIDTKRFDADVAIRLSIANPADALGFFGKKRVLYTMLEVDKIPPFWVDSLNTMDQAWTPSKWGKEVFIKSGVDDDKVKVVPAGVNTDVFNHYREPLIKKEDGVFRFMMEGKWEKRKGVDILCHAFSEEFKEDEKVQLLLDCSTIKLFAPQANIYKDLFTLGLGQKRAEMLIVEEIIPNYSDMGRLYTSADCFVCPTRGEGWNLPLIEAMACGLPSITTNWSGQTEFIDEKYSYLLNDFKISPANNSIGQFFLQFGNWADPSVKELREKMRYVFDNQDEARKKGELAEKEMQKWTWDEAAKKSLIALKELCD